MLKPQRSAGIVRDDEARRGVSDAVPFRALVERVQEVAIFAIDAGGAILSWNVGAARLTGYRRSDILGRHISLLYHNDEPGASGPAQSWSQDAAARRFEQEVWLTRKDGSRFWGDVIFSALEQPFDSSGYAVIIRDRTENRAASEAQRRLTAMLQLTTDFVSFANRDGKLLYVNAAGRAMLGFGAAEDVSVLAIEDVHPQWAAGLILREGVPTALQRGSWSGETALIARDGREIPVLQVLLIHRTPTGEFDFISTIARDITERKHAEAQREFLVEASRQLTTSLDYETTLQTLVHLVVPGLADWCAIAMLEGEALHWTAAAHRDEARAPLLQQRLPATEPLDRDASVGVHRVLTTQQPELVPRVTRAWIESARRAHDSPLDELESHSLLIIPFTARGRILGAMTLGIEGRHRSYGAAELEVTEQLAGRAALAIDNARLFQAEEDAVSTRDEVLSVVAHDLRNPLNTIKMASELILEMSPDLGDMERRQLGVIHRSADTMNRLIQDLLDVARIESGRGLSIEAEPQAVDALLHEACDMLHAQAAAKGLQLECNSATPATIRADRDRMLQVFSNLLGNALKFTETGAVSVTAQRAGGDIEFAVSDTGPGIPEDDQAHLFERFWQARKARRGGAGLGLAIVKGIVEAHGGRIWVVSKVGSGSTFYFTIPAAG